MEWALAITAVSIIAVVVCSNLLINTPVTPTMVFVAVGLLAGPLVLGDIDPSTKSTTVRSLANATLALVLFSDAARIDLRKLTTNWTLPGRLLGFVGTRIVALLRILWRGERRGQELAAATSGPRRCEAARVDGSWRTS